MANAKAKAKIVDFSQNDEMRSEQEPIAFGLKALKITFVINGTKEKTIEIKCLSA